MGLDVNVLKRVLAKAIRNESVDDEPAEVRAEAARLLQRALDNARIPLEKADDSEQGMGSPAPR